MSKYLDAVNKGREVVIVPSENDNESQSAIFYKLDGIFYSFNVEFGDIPRNDVTDLQFESHIQNMLKEGCYVFIRGFESDR